MADVLQSVVGGADGCIFSFGHMSLGKCSVIPVCHMVPSNCPLPWLLLLLSLTLVEEGGGSPCWCGNRDLTVKLRQAEAPEWLEEVSRSSRLALRTLGRFLSLAELLRQAVESQQCSSHAPVSQASRTP